jgi:hypothetical protein
VAELKKITGISPPLAAAIYDRFHDGSTIKPAKK